MWVYESNREFFREAAEGIEARKKKLKLGKSNILTVDRPPVIVAEHTEAFSISPILRGKHRQPLPRIPGQKRGKLSIPNSNCCNATNQRFVAWLVPWRIGDKKLMEIEIIERNRVASKTILTLDVSHQPSTRQTDINCQKVINTSGLMVRAAKVLEKAPFSFVTTSSIRAAFDEFDNVWNDPTLGEEDPLRDLLQTHAKQLRNTLDYLCARPRSILRTEHSMLKLQKVRSIDAKTLRWLSAQPGRNTAERAGARQRIKAPKRYDTIETLENKVLRAYAALTVRKTKFWLENSGKNHSAQFIIEAHHNRARRIETMLRDLTVPEAIPPIIPNFPLRFDRNYRGIWKAWLELLKLHIASELEWMWHQRTFMELLVVRAAIKLNQIIREQNKGGLLALTPVLETTSRPNQGCYLSESGIQITFGMIRNGSLRTIEFQNANDDSPIGAIASAGLGSEIWWNDFNFEIGEDESEGNLPWNADEGWDAVLEKWAKKVIA